MDNAHFGRGQSSAPRDSPPPGTAFFVPKKSVEVLTTVQSRGQCLSCVGCGAVLGKGLFRALRLSIYCGVDMLSSSSVHMGPVVLLAQQQFRLRDGFAAFLVPFGDLQALTNVLRGWCSCFGGCHTGVHAESSTSKAGWLCR